MPQTRIDFADKQGGKKYGMLKKEQEEGLDHINKEFLEDDTLKELEDLEEKLTSYKAQFVEFDLDHSGDIDMMELKQMLEKLGQAKTHMELKKMIKEVDTVGNGTINYRDFLNMMLGTKTSVLKLILMFEEKKKEKAKPVGPPPKKNIADLP